MLKKYVEYLKPYIDIVGLSKGQTPREYDCAASGIIFFYTCLFYTMHFPNWGNHIEDILLYNVLYILFDHYIDDINVQANEKQAIVNQMKLLIEDPKLYQSLNIQNECLKSIAIIYDRLIIRCPNVKPYMIKLFNAEIEGLAVQNNSSFSKQTYYNAAMNKGGYTVLVLQSIMNDSNKDMSISSFKLGEIIQLIDDSQDVDIDMKNNIHTIATNEYLSTGCIDKLWVHIVTSILSDCKFNIFKLLLILVMMYLPDKNPHLYTAELRQTTNKYNLFDRFVGLKSIDNQLIKHFDEKVVY
jgi:hypothetical protein